jgi:SAM-dependent methyltransferase
MAAPRDGTAGYAEAADVLAVQYESITFQQAHAHWLHLFPEPPARVLDVGAGTGRDAAALAKRRYTVTAAEPTSALRAHGERLHGAAAITWVDDSLPDLPGLTTAGQMFDLILLTAVFMHLDADERAASLNTLKQLLAPSGCTLMTLRHGPVPTGRRMFDVSAADVITTAARVGLTGRFLGQRGDVLGRGTVSWSDVALAHD